MPPARSTSSRAEANEPSHAAGVDDDVARRRVGRPAASRRDARPGSDVGRRAGAVRGAVAHPDDPTAERADALGEGDEPVERPRPRRDRRPTSAALGAARRTSAVRLRRQRRRRTATGTGSVAQTWASVSPCGISPTTPLTNLVFFASTVA